MIKAFLLLAIACSLLLSKPNLVYGGNTKSSKHMHNDKDISLCIILCLMNSLVPPSKLHLTIFYDGFYMGKRVFTSPAYVPSKWTLLTQIIP